MVVSVTAKGMTGSKTTAEVETTAGVWFKLGLVNGVSPPNPQVDDVDVTHYESPDDTREFIPGLTNLGNMTVNMNYVAGSDTDTYIIAWRVAKDVRRVRLTYPTAIQDIFPAHPNGYTTDLGDGSGKATAQLTLKVDGAFEPRA